MVKLPISKREREALGRLSRRLHKLPRTDKQKRTSAKNGKRGGRPPVHPNTHKGVVLLINAGKETAEIMKSLESHSEVWTAQQVYRLRAYLKSRAK